MNALHTAYLMDSDTEEALNRLREVIAVQAARISRAEDARDEARREVIEMAKRLADAEAQRDVLADLSPIKVSTTYTECGCSRRYTPEEFKSLGVKRQLVEDAGTLLLAKCVCGSTISLQESW